MNAAPVLKKNNNFEINDLNRLFCKEEEHNNNEIIGICIDNNCNIKNKLLCYKCIFRIHKQHNMIELSEIKENLNKELEIYNKNIDFKNKFENDFNSIEIDFKNKFNEIKKDFIKYFDENLDKYIKHIKNQFKDIINDKNINSNINFQDLLTQINNNNNENVSKIICNYLNKKPSTENNLIEIKTNLYNKINENINNFINKQKEFYEKKIKDDFQQLINNNNNNNVNNFNNNLGFIPINFEWDTKTYGAYNFLYDISQKNIARKSKENGTITVIKSKNILQKNKIYSITFLINKNYGGEYQVGFGNDLRAACCWLKEGPTYYIREDGIYNNDHMLNEKGLKNNDLIKFIIDLIKKKFKIFVGNYEIYEGNFFIEKEIYILAAIRNCNNSIIVKEFYEINNYLLINN